MKQSLDDLALFLAIADAGGLAGAARATGQSPPTLSRRMTALERTLGRHLFERGKRGYSLTSEGRALLAEATPLRDLQTRLNRFANAESRPSVRITAGHWTSRFLARNIHLFWSPSDAWVPEFLPSNATIDIARREADIGIRNARPNQNWLAGRETIEIAYAEYAASPDVSGYLGLTHQNTAPSDRWVHAHRRDQIVTGGSTPQVNLDLAIAGVARIVMPTFAGDTEPGLIRIAPPIDALTHQEWVVAHHDARHDPPIRAALDAITRVLANTELRQPA